MTFGKKAVTALTGVTGRQLDYWARTGVIGPSIKPAAGKGTRREYSFKDLVALKVSKRLKDEGISLQKIRQALTWLRRHFPDLKQPLAELRFLTDGDTIFVLERDRDKILDVLQSQFVFSLALGQLIESLRGEVRELAKPREEKVVVAGQTFTVVLTPDLEDGGFTVQCREEPAAISHGATIPEALDNIMDALELCLKHEKEWQVQKAQDERTRAG
ncbi:MAG: MerR family transcriptional regulator [Deltaproteobacteria bacterium]|nr:MerR family transcriptional regulator [Deltaproteobacteria bacterium]